MKIPREIERDIPQEARYEALVETEPYHENQEDIILRKLWMGPKTPSELVELTNIRLTSVRRACCQLKKEGKILAIDKKTNPDRTATETVYSINKSYKEPVKSGNELLQQMSLL